MSGAKDAPAGDEYQGGGSNVRLGVCVYHTHGDYGANARLYPAVKF